ncbi:MAG: nicotinate-nucleotide--dimethylbenzimidazole phosphoribosyltransferase [Verrucomicrobia bacterium]|nr:nicotinate-nucleotide--dimethylbenzimidazole phosphoribosyltransferase [Verrucomicrobiota bacterium]MCH8526595.1 nicotinate-nucleotide--dimethylbenzimidazole phosphoribosyltransferase [Kiritimatiellia bacterium]
MTLKQALHSKIDRKTKPPGSLGKLETLALQIGLVQQSLTPELCAPALLVYAADHGLSREPVSAFPREVTAAMVLNFLAGGAAINVFTRLNGMDLRIHDVGVDADLPPHPLLIPAKVARGTENLLHGAAMSAAQRQTCLTQSAAHIDTAAQTGCNVIGFGEMGIGNTSSASLIMHAVTREPLETCVGAGTGLQGQALDQKRALLHRAVERHGLPSSPEAILQAYGGFEIAHIAGGMAAAARRNMLVLVDGFIATAAYAVALKMEPALSRNAVFCHCSDEQGHRRFLEHLNASPLLDLGLRLGEGTGCALALPLLHAATAFLNDMASFDDAAVPTK